MQWKFPKLPWAGIRLALGVAAITAAILTYNQWWPPFSAWVDTTLTSRRASAEGESEDEHAGHVDHAAEGEAAPSQSSTLALTAQARLNLGLTPEFLRPLELSTYRKSIAMPAVVVPVPGRSHIFVTSPLNGIITHVHAVTGEAVTAGELLFEVRLTYEDLVETQTLYLKTISELEVEEREITRLEGATQSGAISGKALLERRFATLRPLSQTN